MVKQWEAEGKRQAVIVIMVVKGRGEGILNTRAGLGEQAGHYVAITTNSDSNGCYAFTLHYSFLEGGKKYRLLLVWLQKYRRYRYIEK